MDRELPATLDSGWRREYKTLQNWSGWHGTRTMPPTMTRLAALALVALAACQGAGSPEMHVVGVHEADPHEVVFVQVSNPASRSMRLTKLEYTFDADTGKQFAAGEVDLERDVPAGASVIVEVPLDADPPAAAGPITLRGTLTAELDRIERSFAVSAQLKP
jgi:hypothetical protein